MTQPIEHLREEVSQIESAIDSAVVFIGGLAFRLREALMGGNLNQDIQQLADELDAAQNKLATAIAENTVAAEDSDTTYDPAPIGTVLGGGSDTTTDSAADGTGTSNDSTSYAGEGAVSADTAVDTSATTDSTTYGNQGGDEVDASAENQQPQDSDAAVTDSVPDSNNADGTDSTDENGTTTA